MVSPDFVDVGRARLPRRLRTCERIAGASSRSRATAASDGTKALHRVKWVWCPPISLVDNSTVSIPPGTDQTREMTGEDRREHFLLDIWRGTLRLSKVKHQTRGRKVVVLVRLDIDGAPHTNPDGTKLGGSHLHVYREGYEDKWAGEIDPADFANTSDMQTAFEDFCRYCNIEVPPFQGELL